MAPVVESRRMTGPDNAHFDRGYNGGLAATAYEVNDQVMVFSNHRNAWVEGKVTAVHRDGSCDVKYKENGTVQQVPIQDQPTKMKKDLTAVAATAVPLPRGRRVSATPAIPVPIAEEPVVSVGTVKRLSVGWTKFKVGHRVKVYSQSQQKWVMAEVTKIFPDGACECTYLQANDAPTGAMKNIPLNQQDALMQSFT